MTTLTDLDLDGLQEKALADGLNSLGFYYGETYYYDPNKPTTCWLQSDGAGSSWPVSTEVQALIELALDAARRRSETVNRLIGLLDTARLCIASDFGPAGRRDPWEPRERLLLIEGLNAALREFKR